MIPQPCDQLVTSKTQPDHCVQCEHPVSAHNRAEKVAAVKTFRIWGDTLKPDLCRSPSCRKPIYFAEVVKSGKTFIFDVRPVAISKQQEIGTNREAWVVALTASHFQTCVSAAQFRRRR